MGDIPVEYQGDNYRVLSNGAIYDNSRGRIVAKLPGDKDITPENTTEFYNKRIQAKAKAELAFRSGMAKAGPGKGALSTWAEIGKVQSELATDKERGLSSTRAAEFVGKASGFLAKEADNQAAGGATIQISGDLARYLVDKMAQSRLASSDNDSE
jgi:hypothetical protein